MVLRHNFVGAISWSKGIFPLRWSKPSASVKGTHEMCRVVVVTVSDLKKIALWGFLVCAIRHIVKKGLLRHFITPKNCTKIMQKSTTHISILHKND